MVDILWSELRMEDGSPPGADDVVIVDSDVRLIFDVEEPVAVKGLVVYGTFEAADHGGTLELATDWAVVAGDGTFQVGTPEDPYESDFTLTLAGKDNSNTVDLRDYPDGCEESSGCPITGGDCACDQTDAHGHNEHFVIENNNAYLMAMGEGATISIHADDAAKESWTQLDATLEAGGTSMTFTEATGWQAGDRIAVASTDFDMNQAEEFTILEVLDGGRTVILDRPAEFMHYGEVDTYNDPDGDVHRLDMRAEVALLSRDVTIQGDIDYDPSVSLNEQEDQYGGHTMVMHGGEMYISGAEFAFMGQAGILGRYPTHWHESGDVSGQYIKDSSIHHSFNKGITVHNTQNAEVTDNVVYETISHNYYLEERETYDNVLTGNLGMNARDVGRFGTIRGANDDSPSNFYTPNGDNTWIGNHAAGSDDKGFYFSLGRGDHGARDFDTFVDNTAHSTDGRAFYLNHAGLVQDGNPSGSADQPQKVDPWVAEGFTTYKSDGVYVRGVEGTFTDSAFAEMGSNARFRLNQTIEDSLIVGRSNNIGNPRTGEEIEAGRSLPDGDGNFQGFQLYDGPGSLSNVMFDGFTEDGDGAIELSNAIHKSSSFGLDRITFGEDVAEANKLNIGGGGNAIGVDSWARGLVDVDGSVTGTPGAMIYQYSSDRDGSRIFNAGPDYEIIEEWGAIVSYGTRSGTLRIDRLGTEEENTGNQSRLDHEGMVVTRSDGESATGIRVQIPVFIDYSYEVAYDEIEDDFRLYLHDMDWGDSVIVSLPDTPTDASFIVDDPYSDAARPAREVSSMAMLEASPDTAVFRDAEGVVHVKLVAEMAHGYLWPQPGAAMPGSLHSGVTVLVDTKAEIDLDALVYDDPTPGETLGPPPYADPPPADDLPPPPPVDPDPEGDTVLAYVEKGGQVVIEAEAYGDLPEGWVTKATYDNTAAPDLGALGGRNDFVMWQGADQSDAPGDAVLTYYVLIETPGLYEFALRDQPATDRPEVGGDTWVKIDGARFYGLNGESTMYPEGADPGSFPPGSEPLPAADGEDGWMRYQSTNRSTHWGGGGHVNDTGQRSDRHDIVVEFDAPGVYAIQLAGATPSSHAIGAIGLVNREVASDYSLQGEVSQQIEVLMDDLETDMSSSTDPIARDDEVTLNFNSGQRVRVVENDTLSEGASPSVEILSVTAGLTASVRNTDEIQVRALGSVNRGGEGTVVYRVDDGLGGSDTAEIDVTILPRPNQAPVARDDTASTLVGKQVQVDVDGNDTDANGDRLSVTIIDGPENGAVEVRGNRDIRYTPDSGFVGTEVITYQVDDTFGGTDTATLTIDVRLPEVSATGPVHLANANGNYVFEAESAIDQDRDGGWEFRSADELPNGHAAPTGTGYIQATSPNSFGEHRNPEENPESVLTYNFRAEKDGFVQINLVASYIGDNPTEHNDTWTGILKDGVPVPAVEVQSGAELEPRGSLGLYKTYQSGGSSDEFRVANRNIDNVGRAIVVPVEEGEVYTLVLMERSSGHEVDRIVLTYHEDGDGVSVGPAGGNEPLQAEPLSPIEGSPPSDPPADDPPADDPPPQNRAPVAVDDEASLPNGGRRTVEVLANDTDPDGDTLTITGVTASEGLTAQIVSGGVRVIAEDGFAGNGTVRYTIADGQGDSDEGEIAVEVAAAPSEPAEIALVLYDARSDTAIATLDDGDTIDVDASMLGFLTIAAMPVDATVESVRFDIEGMANKMESVAPYALFGDRDGDLSGGKLGLGTHSLTVTAYEGNIGRGDVLAERSVDFTLVEAGTTQPDPVTPDPETPGDGDGARMEVGTLTIEQRGPDAWYSVRFSDTIPDARVVLGPLSDNGIDPATLRVRDVTEYGFEFQVDEWGHLDGWHMPETLSWMAVSAGTHTLDDGRTISAERTSAANERDSSVSLDGFDNAPIVLTQVTSDNDAAAVTARLTGVGQDGFSVRMQEAEAEDGRHGTETIDWIAIEGGTAGAVDAVMVTGVSDQGRTASIEEVEGELGVLAAMQSFRGVETAALRYGDAGTGAITLTVEEEQSRDEETRHLPETVGLVTVETGLYDLV